MIVAAATTAGFLTTSQTAFAALAAPPANAVALARNEHCIDFARRAATAPDRPTTKPTEPIASAFYDPGATLVLAAAASSGDTSVDGAVIREINHLTIPGTTCGFETFHVPSSEPTAAGGVSAQSELWATSLLVVARATPRIWNALSARQREAAAVIVRASLISNAFVTSDANPYLQVKGQERTIDGGGNVGRDWNPNYREGMLGNVLMGISFFGVAGAQNELNTFDRGKLVSDARRLGLSNIATTFSWGSTHPQAGVPTDAEVSAALKGWAYHGVTLAQPMTLVGNLTAFTYDSTVACGINDGAGLKVGNVVAGRLANPAQCSQLPSLGQVGMLHEFASGDVGGPRSSAIYSYLGFAANLATQVAMLAAGTWRNGPIGGTGQTTDRIIAIKRIGITDLFTKLRLGYVNYSNGRLTTPPGYKSGDYAMRLSQPGEFGNGFIYTQALWNQVVLRSTGFVAPPTADPNAAAAAALPYVDAAKPAPAPATPTTPAPPPVVTPVLTGVALTNRKFAVPRLSKTAKARASKTPLGTAFAFTLSAPAGVQIKIQRLAGGRRAGGRCRAPSPKLVRRKLCTRLVPVGTTTTPGLAAGPNTVAFDGRVGGRALAQGRYRATLTATIGTASSAAALVNFRVVRR